MKQRQHKCNVVHRLVDSILIRSISSLTVLAVLAFVSFSIVIHQAHVAAQDARLVNLCARQRLLIAQTTEEVERLHTNRRSEVDVHRLLQKLAELERTHMGFALGHAETQLNVPQLSTRVRSLYFEAPHQLHAEMLGYLSLSRQLIQRASDDTADVEDEIRRLRSIAFNPPGISGPASGEVASCAHCDSAGKSPVRGVLSSLNAVVRAIQDESERRLRSLQMLASLLLLTTLLALVATFWCVTRPMIHRIRAETTALAETKAASEERAEELQRAVTELNALREEDSRRATAMVNIMSDLKRERTQLENSNQELEQFAYVASHDLKEPLRMVANYTKLLEDEYADQLDGEARKYIGYAIGGAQRMAALIDDLLNFSRVGRMDAPHEAIDLNQILREVVSDLSAKIEEVDAEVLVASELPMVSGNASRLAQLFQNLICNALKFRHPDRQPRIEIQCRDLGNRWEFSVLDNGIGIESEYFDRIFQVFQRLHTIDEYPGTGIGLAVCKKIVEKHGGRIHVESEPGNGTAFRIELPASMALPRQTAEESSPCCV